MLVQVRVHCGCILHGGRTNAPPPTFGPCTIVGTKLPQAQCTIHDLPIRASCSTVDSLCVCPGRFTSVSSRERIHRVLSTCIPFRCSKLILHRSLFNSIQLPMSSGCAISFLDSGLHRDLTVAFLPLNNLPEFTHSSHTVSCPFTSQSLHLWSAASPHFRHTSSPGLFRPLESPIPRLS